MDNKTYTIDATDKVLGRLAVKVAMLLQGKNKIDFARNKNTGDLVIIKNIKNIKVTGNKRQNKIYYHHSGYMGGMKEITFEKLFEKDPEPEWVEVNANGIRVENIKDFVVRQKAWCLTIRDCKGARNAAQ